MRTIPAACAGSLVACFAFLCLLNVTSAAAATWEVSTLADDSSTPPDGSLRKLLSNAGSDDTIVFASSLAQAGGTATITLDDTLTIDKNITIQGPTAYTLIVTTSQAEIPLFLILDDDNDYSKNSKYPIDGPNPDDLDSNSEYWLTVTLKNIRMQNAYGSMGGGIMTLLSEVTCVNCTFASNRSLDTGAAVFAQLCFLHFSDCNFTDNHAAYTGDALYAGACLLDCTNCTFSGNGGSEAGGSIFVEGSIFDLTNCTFSGNYALFSGGAVYSADSEVTVTSCSFSGNSVSFSGNGNDNDRLNDNSPLDIFTDGGALTLTEGTLTLTNSTFSNNTCANSSPGTGAYSCGGALSVVGTLFADSCIFEGNSCTSTYYAAYGGVVSIENDNNDSLALKNCSFNSNSVLSASACGGAIDSNGFTSQAIENCSFISNTSQVMGGALHLRGTSSLSCINTTFYNNSSNAGSVLYATANVTLSTLQFLFDTIVDNTTHNGSAISLEFATAPNVTLTNTLLTNTNSFGWDIAIPNGTRVSLTGGNFIGSISGGYTDAYARTSYASLIGVRTRDLFLSTLRALETTTAKLQVLIPKGNSPVLDAAVPSSVTTDARGMSRPQLGKWDSGAIEAIHTDWIDVGFSQPWFLIFFGLLLLGGTCVLTRSR